MNEYGLILMGCSLALLSIKITAHAEEVVKSAEMVSPVKIESAAPSATIRNINSEQKEFNEIIDGKPTVLIFYRGGWCPFCNIQLGQLASIEDKLEALGFQIIAVSPDHPEKLKESLNKNQIKYTLYSDSKMELAKKYQVAFQVDMETVKMYKEKYNIDLESDSGEKHHLLPVPAAFIINSKGIIKYRYYNADYKVRVNPEELLEAARNIME